MKFRDAMRFSAAVGFLVGMLCLASILSADEPPAKPDPLDAVVRIGGCSGVCVSPDGIVLTAKHCTLAEREQIYFRGREPVWAKRVYVGRDAEDVVAFDCDGDEGFPFRPLAEAVAESGSDVWSAGYPNIDGRRLFRRAEGKIVRGFVATYAVNNIPRGTFLANETTLITGPGWSGGPLFDGDGRVVGVLTSGDSTGTSFISFAATQRAFAAATASANQSPNPAAMPAAEKTKLWAFTASWCRPCREFRRDLDRGKWGQVLARSDDGVRVETEQLEVRFYDVDDPLNLTKLRDVQSVLLKATGRRYQEAVPAFYVPGRNEMQVGYASTTGCFLIDGIKAAFTSPSTPIPPRPSVAVNVELGEPEPYVRLRPIEPEPDPLFTPFKPATEPAEPIAVSEREKSILQKAEDALAKSEAAVAKAREIADAVRGDPQPAKDDEPASWTLLGLLAGIARFWIDRKAVA